MRKCFSSENAIDAGHLAFKVLLEQHQATKNSPVCKKNLEGFFFLPHALALSLSVYQGHAADTHGKP